MGIASFILGLLTATGVCVSFIPLLNFTNCLTLPVALLGAILGLVDLVRERPAEQGKGMAIAGLVLNGLALLVGGVRFIVSLLISGGIL